MKYKLGRARCTLEKAHASDVYILPLTMCGYYGGYVLLDIATCWALHLSIPWSAKAQKCGQGRLEHSDVEIFFWLTWAMFPTYIQKEKYSVSFIFFGKVVICVILTYRKWQCLTWPANTKWTQHGFLWVSIQCKWNYVQANQHALSL